MADKTKGYSFAFQLLGYLYWNALCSDEFDKINHLSIELDYESYLAEFVYDKIWSEEYGVVDFRLPYFDRYALAS